ncbi:MAG: MGMT family protein [Fimbriimonadales bacterium]
MKSGTLPALWEIVREIPKGKVMSYGDVGKLLPNPCSGFLVGRWMAQAPDGVPWWRVVAQSGNLPIGKRGYELAEKQAQKLKREGVRFLRPGLIDMEKHRL